MIGPSGSCCFVGEHLHRDGQGDAVAVRPARSAGRPSHTLPALKCPSEAGGVQGGSQASGSVTRDGAASSGLCMICTPSSVHQPVSGFVTPFHLECIDVSLRRPLSGTTRRSDGTGGQAGRCGGAGLCRLRSMFREGSPARIGLVFRHGSGPQRGPWQPSPGADNRSATLPAAPEALVPSQFPLRPSTRMNIEQLWRPNPIGQGAALLAEIATIGPYGSVPARSRCNEI